MKFGSDSFSHEQHCTSGHSSASTIASVEAAMSADPDLDNSAITIRMLGPVILLEGYVKSYAERERATSIAALIAGPENVRDRMLGRIIEH